MFCVNGPDKNRKKRAGKTLTSGKTYVTGTAHTKQACECVEEQWN